MSDGVIYVIAAYLGAGALYGGYLAWLLGQERRLRGGRRDAAR